MKGNEEDEGEEKQWKRAPSTFALWSEKSESMYAKVSQYSQLHWSEINHYFFSFDVVGSESATLMKHPVMGGKRGERVCFGRARGHF